MKKSVILCCVTCCLLSAFPESQGSKLKDSLYCVMQFSKNIVTCSWSESRISRQFVNMTLMQRDRSPMCETMEPVIITPTHLHWTCHKNFTGGVLYDEIHLIFLPDRSLESRLNVSNEGDEAKPKNLLCQVSDDRMITCSWEVREEAADSVDFTLYYQNDLGKEEACNPRCWQEIPLYLSCACNFTAGDHDNPIQFHNISVRPTEPETSYTNFKICKNIKLMPRILSIEERNKGETFLINWKHEHTELSGFRYHYELCYWRENDMNPNEQVASNCTGDTKTLSPNDDTAVLLQLGTQLKPSSNYSVKVRVRLGEKDPEFCYKGPWSEWSNVETFHTKSVPNILLLCIVVLCGVVVLVISTICGCKALLRYKKKLDDRIPNPSKSSIIKGLQKAKDRLVIRYLTLQNGPSLPYEEHLYVEPYNKVLMWAPRTKETNLKQDEEENTRPDSELLQHDDTQCLFLFNMTKEEYPTASITDGYKPFSELIDEQENRDMEDSQFTFCAFDGPYLFS